MKRSARLWICRYGWHLQPLLKALRALSQPRQLGSGYRCLV
ncbi:hypothetical protein C4K40_0646 [Pseudomonas sp. CMR5c]|nr:hypothetical protein C4K40_0646 [Pseudomonas sp. CMR5c]